MTQRCCNRGGDTAGETKGHYLALSQVFDKIKQNCVHSWSSCVIQNASSRVVLSMKSVLHVCGCPGSIILKTSFSTSHRNFHTYCKSLNYSKTKAWLRPKKLIQLWHKERSVSDKQFKIKEYIYCTLWELNSYIKFLVHSIEELQSKSVALFGNTSTTKYSQRTNEPLRWTR